MIPIDGPVRENVGLLGSPSFEIPRMVDRDRALCTALPEAERLERLKRKNRHNLATAIMFLAAQWMLLLGTIAIWRVALMSHQETGFATFFVASVSSSAVAIMLACLIERASLGFRPLQPRMTTIYEPHFWSHERHWKLADSPVLRLFPGTPFKNLLSRVVGFEVGRKVYDGGCIVTERTLTKVGDYANLNEGSVLQAHSLEEGVFKSDYIRLAEGVTVGPNAFVHYGVQMERCSTLDADSFLMKGETVEAGTTWRGNPARPRSRASTEALETDGSTAGAKLFVPTVAAE
jgi:non-ribosomal peptide synthetase-like protein